ncbi:MAG: CDGSH iron-sulfur domain-containing protein [Myxococcota bacterium]
MADTKVHTYKSDTMTVHWDQARCIHAGACTRGLRAVFDVKKKPWIQPDQADDDAIAATVAACPSGALWAERANGIQETPPAKNTVRLEVNGPMHLHGNLHLGEEPAPGAGTRASLCRCGKSRNMPYCDNHHKEAGWKDPAAPPAGELATIEATGPLAIQAFPNGPVQVTGGCEIVDRDGNAVFRGSQTWLCRCGQSSNKPFCDGSHKAAGFSTEAP